MRYLLAVTILIYSPLMTLMRMLLMFHPEEDR